MPGGHRAQKNLQTLFKVLDDQRTMVTTEGSNLCPADSRGVCV